MDNAIAYRVPVSFIDVAKHGPEGVKLSALGDQLGLEKLDIPEGYSIARMDELLAGDRQAFVNYGIRDAEIAVKYYLQVLRFARENIWSREDQPSQDQSATTKKSQRKTLPVSAGALAVQLCKKTFEENGLDFEELFGLEERTKAVWDPIRQRLAKKTALEQDDMRSFHEPFAIKSFHGGHNECYRVGFSSPRFSYETFILAGRDYDLIGAYTTGLVLVREINYAKSFQTQEICEFLGDVMGFALVDFKYPEDVRYPALPVRCAERGLLFPLEGRSYATAPEVALAYAQGAEITIQRGVIYPWKDPDGVRIFAPFVREIRRLRKCYPKGSVSEQTAKLLGNSLYGKTGQGLRDKTAFDTHVMESMKVPYSGLTNAPIAALTTGFVRAVIGEILHRLPPHCTVFSVTTDGILTDASEDELDLTGPLCQRYLQLCEMVQS